MDLWEIKVSFTNSPANLELLPDCMAAVISRTGIQADKSHNMITLITDLISEGSTSVDDNHKEIAEIIISLEVAKITLSVLIQGRSFNDQSKQLVSENFCKVFDDCVISSERGGEVITVIKALQR